MQKYVNKSQARLGWFLKDFKNELTMFTMYNRKHDQVQDLVRSLTDKQSFESTDQSMDEINAL